VFYEAINAQFSVMNGVITRESDGVIMFEHYQPLDFNKGGF
jgi:hypothetical protein